MISQDQPVLDPRDSAEVFGQLLSRAPAYTPELTPVAGGAEWSEFQIFARYMQAIIQRLNKAPDKNLLAFLDTMGISLIPAQAAEAPVVFQPVPRAANAQVPASAQLGAKVAGQQAPLTFETENAIAMAAAKLIQVAVVWPDRDEFADYSAAVSGGREFTLFDSLDSIPHEIYLAHNTLFAFSGKTTIQLEFELATPGDTPVNIAWEFWDGQVWKAFAPFDPNLDPNPSIDGTDGLTRSGVITLNAECGKSAQTTVAGIQGFWIRGRLTLPFPPDPSRVLALVQRIRARLVLDKSLPANVGCSSLSQGTGVQFDTAFAGTAKVDLTSTVFPFDKQPQTGSGFYFSSQEVFSKAFAAVTLCFAKAAIAQQPDTSNWAQFLVPKVNWEYWNGSAWAPLTLDQSGDPTTFLADGPITFKVPGDLAPTQVNNQNGLWMRARLVSLAPQSANASNYGGVRQISYTGPALPNGQTTFGFNIVELVPPAINTICLGYIYESPWSVLDQCLTYNDFQWENHTRDVRWPGVFFPAFRPTTDNTPSLYLGFDQPLPNDLVSLYLDIQETQPPTITLVWEGWDGTTWQVLQPTDETRGLSLPGMVSFIAPPVAARPQAAFTQASGNQVVTGSAQDAFRFQAGDQVVVAQGNKSELGLVQGTQDAVVLVQTPLAGTYTTGTISRAALPRFGTSLDWVRARLKDDGAPSQSNVNGIYLNAVWAIQLRSITNENLGAGNGQASQAVTFNQAPVLPGERIEVREVAGPRAEIELPILTDELLSKGFTSDDIRTTSDPRTGKVTEIWVRWQWQPHLYFSGPDDRHYTVERASGRLRFGDGDNGALVPVSALILARAYQSGGGLIGNVPVGAISQLLTGVLAQSVSNPRVGEGGADVETLDEVMERGPNTFRHLGRALAAVDYESLAFEASPAVAAVRVLPTTASNGLPEPGFVTVIIVPHSQEAQPQPSFGLRKDVHDYLALRAPATARADRIAVIGPTYLLVGVYAAIVPRHSDDAGAIEVAATAALRAFLNPVTGGPEGQGWPFGRGVFLSDIAVILQGLDGVDYVRELELIVNDAPVGDQVSVPPDRILAAGSIQIAMQPAVS